MKDVVIIGSGAGAGPLALTLARAGAEVLVVEKGPRYGREDYRTDEIPASRRGFFQAPFHQEAHFMVSPGQEVPSPTNLGWVASCVGGGTVPMGGNLYRFHPDDFRMQARYGDFEELADWPYGYEELEPYYSRAEWAVGVSGDGDGNPFEGFRSQPYPMPPLDEHPLSSRLQEACTALGLTAFPTPRSINSRPYDGRPSCVYCEVCSGYGCAVGAKGSTQETLLEKAEATGRCQVLAGSMVREVTVDGRGLAKGCKLIGPDGEEKEVVARAVCVCCSAVESARLLLLSRSKYFPNGLGNNSGLVGRHLQFHSYSGGMGYFERSALGELAGSDCPFLGRSVMDYYFLPPGVSDIDKGGLLRFEMQPKAPIATAQRIAEADSKRLWGGALLGALEGLFEEFCLVDFEVFHDYLPNRGTYLELSSEREDRWGLPSALIHLDASEHHRKAGGWLVEKSLEIFDGMGASKVGSLAVGQPTNILVHGTCRAGHDPRTSVLNGYCQSHEVKNLFVVDGSFMPTSGGAPPTLTILANSFRTADYLLDKARAGDLW